MHPDIAKLVEAGRIPQEVGERLSEISPGNFCTHKNWGAGKVKSWDIQRGKVVIDFEKQSNQEMALQFAIQKTELLDPEHFSAIKLENIDELRDLVKNDPAELVKRTLESHDGSMMLDQLDRELCGSVVPEEDYKKWWEKAKKAMREQHQFSVPSKRTDPLVLRSDSLSPAEMLVADFTDNRDPKQKIKALENLRKSIGVFADEKDHIQRLVDEINAFCLKGRKLHLSTVLEFLVARDEIIAEIDGVELDDSDLRLADVITTEQDRLTKSLKGRSAATQRAIFEAFPSSFGDAWSEEMLKVFDEVGSRGVTEIAKYLQDNGADEVFHEHLSKSISNRSLGPDALIWICREREKASAEVFTFEIGNSILNLLERDHVADGPSRSARLKTMFMSDKTLISDVLADASEADARQFGRKLYSSPVFTDLDRKSLMARVIKARPETQDLVTGEFEKKVEGVISSSKSIERRKADLDEIVKVKIPENTKEIAVARSYGDLRENFEFKAAKQMQAVLMRRKSQLEKELAHVQATEFKGADTSEVNIGTIVHLADDAGNKIQYTILGAWDSIPEENVVSYLSNIGMALIGAKPGDQVEVRDLETEKIRNLTIESIEAYN
ncbi:MAG: GreA/GreB family elongation factor [Akkermansiaceae bacterium]